MSRYRIVLADEHGIVRAGLKSLLEKHSELIVAGEAQNGRELLEVLQETPCDLIILGIVMPEMDGLTALKEIRRKYPQVRVLMHTMVADYAHVEQAKSLGANGYLAKEDACEELIQAIEKIRKGGVYVSPSVKTLLAERHLSLIEQSTLPSVSLLTPREKQVLRLIAKGLPNKNIALELKISIHTVENHRAHLYAKLGLKNAAALIRFAIENGLG